MIQPLSIAVVTGVVATFRPLRKIVIASETFRMSSRKCEMKTMLRPLALEPDQNAEQPLDLRRRQGGGRLVEDDDARAGEQHAGELDELLHADREIAEPRARIDVEPEALELLARLARHVAPGHDAEAVDRLRAEKHVLGDGRAPARR